jgi:hypothetical protein
MELRMIPMLPAVKVASVNSHMGRVLLIFFLATVSSADGQTLPPAASKTPSIGEQIEAEWARSDKEAEKHNLSFRELKAKWARANKDAENGPKSRPWDRDAHGDRPWDRKFASPPKE